MTTNPNSIDSVAANQQAVNLSSKYIADHIEQDPLLVPAVDVSGTLTSKQLVDLFEQLEVGKITEE